MKKIMFLLCLGIIFLNQEAQALSNVWLGRLMLGTDKSTARKLPDNLNPVRLKSNAINNCWQNGQNPSQPKREVTTNGEEIKVKSGNVKVTAKPGKSKVETPTYESKIKGNERKFKSKVNDTKIKTEPGKAKNESDATKVKIKEKDQ